MPSYFALAITLTNGSFIQERLEREYNLSLITTAPSVVYRVNCVNGDTVIFSSIPRLMLHYPMVVGRMEIVCHATCFYCESGATCDLKFYSSAQ